MLVVTEGISTSRTRTMQGGERARLVESHLPLVRQVAARLIPWARPYLEMDDLIAIGAEALLRASDRYEEGRGVPFGSFAYLRVRGAMWEGIGAVGPFSRGVLRRRRGRPERQGSFSLHCFDDRQGNGGGAHHAVEEQLTHAIEAARLGPRLAAALELLDERDRQVIIRHYFAGETLDEIARAMGHSRSWASRIHGLALARLRAALEPAPHRPRRSAAGRSWPSGPAGDDGRARRAG